MRTGEVVLIGPGHDVPLGGKAVLNATLLITRRLPDRVLDAARARFDVTLRDRTDVLSADELRAALARL